MAKAIVAAITAAAALSACNNEQSQQAQPTQTIRVRGEVQDQLFKLNDLNRAIALKRAIYDSGYQCKRITQSGFSGTYKNLDMWMASCADGRNWAVFTGPDGSAQVRDCKDLAGLGLPQCTIKPAPNGAAPKAG